jgi:hypothetical protein
LRLSRRGALVLRGQHREDGDRADFDKAAMEDDRLVGWARGLAPDPARAAAERADRHRILSSRAASETERYRTILTL